MASAHRASCDDQRRGDCGAGVDGGMLSDEQGVRLARGSASFRQTLINALRMVRGNSKDLTVPLIGSEDLLFLVLGDQDMARTPSG